jgi:hypothetical protein
LADGYLTSPMRCQKLPATLNGISLAIIVNSLCRGLAVDIGDISASCRLNALQAHLGVNLEYPVTMTALERAYVLPVAFFDALDYATRLGVRSLKLGASS